MTNAERLQEIKERLAAATPMYDDAPLRWRNIGFTPGTEDDEDRIYRIIGQSQNVAHVVYDEPEGAPEGANADLITNAPEDITWLIAELKKADAHIVILAKKLREALND